MEPRQIITIPAQVMGMNPRADRSWRLVFETGELGGDDVKILADNFQGVGWLVFKPNDDASIELSEIPNVDADAGTESPSVKLRKRLFILWKQRGGEGSFEKFYFGYYQKLLNSVETMLEPKGDEK